jgi:hypothetical protein
MFIYQKHKANSYQRIDSHLYNCIDFSVCQTFDYEYLIICKKQKQIDLLI